MGDTVPVSPPPDFRCPAGNVPCENGRNGVADLPLGFTQSATERELIGERLDSRRITERNAAVQPVVPLRIAVTFGFTRLYRMFPNEDACWTWLENVRWNDSYGGLAAASFKHEAINHAIKEYVNGKCHLNGVESVCALLKRL